MLNYDCVIIDSGVNLLHSKLKNSKIDGISLTFGNSMNLVVGNNIQDRLGHGTAVYSIIKQNSPMKS